jgi:hypothetical protein
MSEYSGLIELTEILWDQTFLSYVTSFTVFHLTVKIGLPRSTPLNSHSEHFCQLQQNKLHVLLLTLNSLNIKRPHLLIMQLKLIVIKHKFVFYSDK